MDMLYARYSRPMDLLNPYIQQGRLWSFVHNFMMLDYERRKEEAEKDMEWKLWIGYVHSFSDMSYQEWKDRVVQHHEKARPLGSDQYLTDAKIQQIVNHLFRSSPE